MKLKIYIFLKVLLDCSRLFPPYIICLLTFYKLTTDPKQIQPPDTITLLPTTQVLKCIIQVIWTFQKEENEKPNDYSVTLFSLFFSLSTKWFFCGVMA